MCIDTESLKQMDHLNYIHMLTHTRSQSDTHPGPCGALACAPQPTCNQVGQWLSEIALATLSWVWWETGLILWWIPALPRFRQGKNERVMPSLTHSNVSWDRCVSVCICERVREGEMRKSRQTGKGTVIIPNLQVVWICFESKIYACMEKKRTVANTEVSPNTQISLFDGICVCTCTTTCICYAPSNYCF